MLKCNIFSESNLDLEIEVADVAGVWLHAEHPGDFVALLAGEVVVKVEHRLLPVSVPDKIRCEHTNQIYPDASNLASGAVEKPTLL